MIDLDPATEAIARYRNEKAKRAERLAQRPEMVAARQAFEASLDAARQAGKGGRPRKNPAVPKGPVKVFQRGRSRGSR